MFRFIKRTLLRVALGLVIAGAVIFVTSLVNGHLVPAVGNIMLFIWLPYYVFFSKTAAENEEAQRKETERQARENEAPRNAPPGFFRTIGQALAKASQEAEASGMRSCPHCNGGSVSFTRKNAFGHIVYDSKACIHCHGTGRVRVR